MAATVVSFSTIPKTRVDGGDVRFFPVVAGNTTPIVSYYWNFGDGATSATPSPTHTFGATQYTFDVSVYVTDAATLTSNTASADFKIDTAAHVPAIPADGSYIAVSVVIYEPDNTTRMVVNRSPSSVCSLWLLNPKISSLIDTSGTATFSLIVPQSATATERALISEDMYVAIVQGYEIVFTGVIRRVTQSTQGLFGASTPIQVWDVECDSDLMKLSKVNVISTSLKTSGATVVDSPGNILRRILDVVSGYWDWRGDIMTTDSVVEYQVNPSTVVDQVPSQYEQLMSLETLTNYDLISRMDWDVFDYADYSFVVAAGIETLTINNLVAESNAYANAYVFFITGSPIGFTASCLTQWSAQEDLIGGNPLNMICGCVSIQGTPPVSGTCIIMRQPKIDFAPNLSTVSYLKTFSVNKDVFGFSDNDDKRKLYTKVVAKGKDLQGNNISVSLAGVHAYDYERQFFNQSTFISRKSEGYIYKNNFAGANKAVTVTPGISVAMTTNFGVSGTKIAPASSVASFIVGYPVVFLNGAGMSGLKYSPQSLIPLYYYYVVSNDGTDIEVSDTVGGTAINIVSDATGSPFVEVFGKFQIDNSDSYLTTPGQEFFVSAAVLPSGITSGAVYSVVGVPGTSATEKFNIQRAGIPWYDAFGSTGTTVIINKLPLSGMSELGTSSKIWLYGWDYTIPTGTVLAASIPGKTATAVTTTGAPVEGIDTNGVKYTEIALTSWLLQDFSGRGFLLSPRLYVDNYSVVGNNEVLIGEEKITITASGKSTTYGNYIDVGTAANRITSATKKCYPHDVGSLVARTTYTEASPEALSVYSDYGCRINTSTVETNTTYGKLDSYATAILLGFGAFYKKATCWMPIYNAAVPRVGILTPNANRTTMPRLGDVVGIIETTGATPVDYQIVGININYDEGKVELQLGDYEKNIFTSLQGKTSGLNQTIT